MRLALYGMPELDESAHDECNIAQFCRNPLHPGPCKGWRRTAGVLDVKPHAEVKPKVEPPKRVRKAAAKVEPPAVEPEPPKKTGPRDGDGDGKLNEGDKPKGGARVRAMAASHRAALEAADGKGDGTAVGKREIAALIKKGHLERRGDRFHLTDSGQAALEADRGRKTRPAAEVKPAVEPPKPDAPKDATGAEAGGFEHRSAGKDLFASDAAGLAHDVLKNRDKQQAADGGLAVIGAHQGYDKPPRVASREEVDALIKNGAPAVFRGVSGLADRSKSAAQIHEDMRSGHAWYGLGIYGNGYYWGDPSHAAMYADSSHGSTARAALDPNAKVADYWDHLELEHEAYLNGLKGQPDEAALREAYSDPGRYAAARGYDALRIVPSKGEPWYNVLNRTALVVEEAE